MAVFLRREWNRNWPFLAGFAITGYVIAKFTAGLTEGDAENSRSFKNTTGELLMLL